MTSAETFILRLAVDHGLVPPQLVGSATLLELLRTGAIDGQRLARLLADHFALPYLDDLSGFRPSPELTAKVPRTLAERHCVFPLEIKGRVLRVAVFDPLDTDNLEAFGRSVNMGLELSVSARGTILEAIHRIDHHLVQHVSEDPGSYDPGSNFPGPAAGGAETQEGFSEGPDAPIMTLVWSVINDAIQRGASDIHLEPMATRLRVRNRVDGVMREVSSLPSKQQTAIVARIKIMAHLSIAEKRLPQDGRIRVDLDQHAVDLRVSSVPTAHGESVVLRILDKKNLRIGLPELGFSSEDRHLLERIIRLPDGIVLVTGPTGSGKTTTLYSVLHSLNQPSRKIVTVEDPVEYQLAGINQVAVRSEVGMTFANALRAILRQSPDIVMVGEIRDRETAEIATHAALTGHLVFSTLHTNDACGAVTRLVDLGVKPFLVASSLRAVVAQRLARKVCVACRRWRTPTPSELRALGMDSHSSPSFRLAEAMGCPICHDTGYKGRVGIFELLVIDDEMQNIIHQRGKVSSIRSLARERGARSLRQDAFNKVVAGVTTLDEALSLTVDDTL